MTNELMIVKKNKTYLGTVPGTETYQTEYVATVLKNIESLGYTLSKYVVACLMYTQSTAIVEWYHDTIGAIKQAKGGNVRHSPMYKGFPEEVMEASDAKLYIDQMMHYIGKAVGLCIMPVSEDRDRFPLIDNHELQVLELALDSDVHELCGNIMSSNASISEADKKIVEWYFTDFTNGNIATILPSIPNKENLCIVSKCLYKCGFVSGLSDVLTTATDILRFVVAMSGGDVSLAEKTKFKNFKRSERRLILDLLNNVGTDAIEDMFRHRNAWLRLGERLHPGDFRNAYPVAYGCFTWLRNDKFYSFASKIEMMIEKNEINEAAKALVNRPGEFARRLDKLLRHCSDNTVMNYFDTIADKVSTPVLIQLRDHFKNRNSGLPRFAMPKGATAKLAVFPKAEGTVDDYIAGAITAICEDALLIRFGAKSQLGKVFIDPSMQNFLLPQSQRSANAGLMQVSRGSKFDIGSGNILRFFLHWKGYIDVDLSAVFFDEKWKQISHVSYTNLKEPKIGACHSGDITTAPSGASEFIDVDINKCINRGIRYISMDVLVYSGINFDELEDCFAGWMTRENDTGEIFEVKTVQNKFDITCAAKNLTPAIFDLVERKVIWVDMSFSGSAINNIEYGMSKIQLIGETFSNMKKMNLQELFTMHAFARGAEIVENREDADLVYAEDGDIKPYDLDVIASEYMS